jgi:hypothetical protein
MKQNKHLWIYKFKWECQAVIGKFLPINVVFNTTNSVCRIKFGCRSGNLESEPGGIISSKLRFKNLIPPGGEVIGN